MTYNDMVEEAKYIYEQVSLREIVEDMESSDQFTEDEFWDVLFEDDPELEDRLFPEVYPTSYVGH